MAEEADFNENEPILEDIPGPTQGGPPEVATLVEHTAQANPPVPKEPAEPPVPSAVPGPSELEKTDFGAKGIDEDTDFFLKDIVRPKGQEEEAAAKVEPSTPEPEEPVSVQASPASTIDLELLGIAENFGLTKEEAESYGTPEHLLRTLNIMSRQREAAKPAGVKEAATPPAPPPEPEPELEFPDPKELESAGFDPAVVKMAQSMKAMHDRYKAKLEEVDKVLPNLVGEMQRRQQADRQKAVEDTFKEAGFDAKSYAPAVLSKIVSRISAVYKTYTDEGEKPPVTDIIKAMVPLVTGKASTGTNVPVKATNGTPPNNDAEKAAAKRRAAASALAKRMERNGVGQFTGVPTHRHGGEQLRGGALRQTLLDKGYDPKDSPHTGSDESNVFLPG